jgi:hypothetical protein
MHLVSIISQFDCIPKRLERIVCYYMIFLMLKHKKHELRTAARLFSTHESNFSRLLSHEKARPMSRSLLNRAIKRRLSKVSRTENDIYLIIDSTLMSRSGKRVKNFHKFRHGGPYICGHQFTNFVLRIGDEIIPLCSVPFYNKKYCREIGVKYRTEIEMITEWISNLRESGLLPKSMIEKLHFLLDSGYDARSIQNIIAEINAKFTVGLTCERRVNGLSVKEYFRRNRQIPWKTIWIKELDGLKKKRRKFRVRAVNNAHLRWFEEEVNVVCSEKTSRIAGKTRRKYIATNDLTQSPRTTVITYSKRWKIENWHKNIKQNHGFGDCRSKAFSAIETHVNFVLCADVLLGLKDPNLLRRGVTLDQYKGAQDLKKAARVIDLFDGRKKMKTLAQEEIRRVVNG